MVASLLAAMVNLLAPDGRGGGISKHLKFLTSLFLVCVLIVPIKDAIDGLYKLANGEITLPWLDVTDKDDYTDRTEDALDSASEAYFTQMLTQNLVSRFSLSADDLRCDVTWEEEGEERRPARVRVILSGKALWQDPHAIEDYIRDLLGCDCITAIE